MKRVERFLIAILLAVVAGGSVVSASGSALQGRGAGRSRPAQSKALKSGAKIKMKEARATALAQVPGGGRIRSSELERENGQLLYSFDIRTRAGIKEVHVDAITGKVLEVKDESTTNEANEQRQERRERKRRRS